MELQNQKKKKTKVYYFVLNISFNRVLKEKKEADHFL